MFSKLFSYNRAIYEIMLKKLVIAGVTTDDNILRRMRIECWMIKATDTNLEFVTLIVFLQKKWLHESVCKLCLCVDCLYC